MSDTYLRSSSGLTVVNSAGKAFITTSYSSGIMSGDIKGAFLSDTSTASVTGTELVTNGTFDTGTTGWTLSAGSQGGTITVNGSNQLVITQGSNSAVMYATQFVTTVVGKTYVASVTVVSTTEANYFRMWIGTSANTSNLGTTGTLTTAGTYSITFTATSTTSYITLNSDQNASRVTIWDNVSARLAEEDRSVNNKGLAVYGTITKTAVATGAELVSYNSSTDNSGYLQKPLTSSDFDLTSPWSISFWVEKIETGGSGSDYTGIQITEDDLTSNSSYSKIPFSIYLRRDAGDIGFRGASVTGFILPDPFTSLNVWRCFTTTFDGSGTLKFYMDGIYQYSTPATFVNPSNKYSLQIMSWAFSAAYYKNDNYNFSLFKMSNSAPSPEQIKKIYEDEKVLFQENAKCTLYGSSDAVTALAYDDDNQLLHVGTSSGRSDFQGLRRINNTTTAVTTAISASNGLIAEQ